LVGSDAGWDTWLKIMGKRSDKPKIQKDKYYTPKEAVIPLLPHLLQHTTFDEPCAGNGTLVSHLIENKKHH
jgi:hypothetical protein